MLVFGEQDWGCSFTQAFSAGKLGKQFKCEERVKSFLSNEDSRDAEPVFPTSTLASTVSSANWRVTYVSRPFSALCLSD